MKSDSIPYDDKIALGLKEYFGLTWMTLNNWQYTGRIPGRYIGKIKTDIERIEKELTVKRRRLAFLDWYLSNTKE